MAPANPVFWLDLNIGQKSSDRNFAANTWRHVSTIIRTNNLRATLDHGSQTSVLRFCGSIFASSVSWGFARLCCHWSIRRKVEVYTRKVGGGGGWGGYCNLLKIFVRGRNVYSSSLRQGAAPVSVSEPYFHHRVVTWNQSMCRLWDTETGSCLGILLQGFVLCRVVHLHASFSWVVSVKIDSFHQWGGEHSSYVNAITFDAQKSRLFSGDAEVVAVDQSIQSHLVVSFVVRHHCCAIPICPKLQLYANMRMPQSVSFAWTNMTKNRLFDDRQGFVFVWRVKAPATRVGDYQMIRRIRHPDVCGYISFLFFVFFVFFVFRSLLMSVCLWMFSNHDAIDTDFDLACQVIRKTHRLPSTSSNPKPG